MNEWLQQLYSFFFFVDSLIFLLCALIDWVYYFFNPFFFLLSTSY